jgi:hypothetical protein
MISAGVEQRDVVLLLSDSQLSRSFVLEDVNSLLNAGDVAQVFT